MDQIRKAPGPVLDLEWSAHDDQETISSQCYQNRSPSDGSSQEGLRIGGACALLAAGKSDLVIRLMGRWSSWCFTVYTRLRPGMIPDAASAMNEASAWECHEANLAARGGTPARLNREANQVVLPLTVISKEESGRFGSVVWTT